MADTAPDYSLQRDGVTLAQWLWRLVDKDPQTRQRASEALQAIQWGLPSIHTDLASLSAPPDFAGQAARFAQAVHDICRRPDFDTPQFVRRLVAFAFAITDDWDARSSRSTARTDKYDQIADRVLADFSAAKSESEQQRGVRNFWRVTAAEICGKDPLDQAEQSKPTGVAVFALLDMLAEELLTAPELVELMLSRKGVEEQALSALARVGPPAASFAPRLLAELDRAACPAEGRFTFNPAKALAAISRDNPELIAQLVERLTNQSSAQRLAVVETFIHLGPHACGREQQIVELLAPMLERELEYCAALDAMASVGRNLPTARRRVLSFTQPRPPEWRSLPEFPEHRYDMAMGRRGHALSALDYFTDYAEECLPALLEALDSFQEDDQDVMYGGPHARVAAVVQAFGPGAAPIATALVKHLDDDPEGYPVAILEALAAIGPAAAAALPNLIAFRNRGEDLEPLDPTHPMGRGDLVGWVIQRIQGIPQP